MGVKELWSILSPFCERKALFELQGKTVAVDLACWVCEALTVVEYSIQPRFYLRNLYFRLCYLLLMDVTPVFVLDGKAPVLKYDVISQRNDIQFKGSRQKKSSKKPQKTTQDRSRFNCILRQCEELINCMGMKCVQGLGEAEAMCAYLNEDGLVDGCITQDSDCFVYGAKIVYRNFSVSRQGSAAASGGAIDVYNIDNVIQSIDLGREKMVALALICGCDYNQGGVFGVGRDSVLKFLNKYKSNEILDRIRSWRSEPAKFKKLEEKINNQDICTSCGHFGKVQKHTSKGCFECGYARGCNSALYREERLLIKNELSIRLKALNDPNFPNEEIIQEFLNRNEKLTDIDVSWKQPDLISFTRYMKKFLDWEEIYSVEKFLPILTRWQLLNHNFIQEEFSKKSNKIKGVLLPDFIKKKRTPKGIPSYEMVWKDTENYFSDLIPSEQIEELKINSNEEDILLNIWSTIEPQNLVEKAYPNLVEQFLVSKIKKSGKKTVTKKNKKLDLELKSNNDEKIFKNVMKKKKKNVKNLEDSFSELNLENQENQTKKSPVRNNAPKKIDSFIKKGTLEPNKDGCSDQKSAINVKNTNSADVENKSCSPRSKFEFDLNITSGESEDDMDLSLVIEKITSKKPLLPKDLLKKGYNIKYEKEMALPAASVLERNGISVVDNSLCEFNIPSSNEESSDEECESDIEACSSNNKFNVSYFFDPHFTDNDIFEKTLDKNLIEISSDTDSSENEENYSQKEEIISDYQLLQCRKRHKLKQLEELCNNTQCREDITDSPKNIKRLRK